MRSAKGSRLYYGLIVLLVGVFGFAVSQLWGYFSDIIAGEALAGDLAARAVVQAKPNAEGEAPAGAAFDGLTGDMHGLAAIYVDFDVLLAENEDVVAWLYCPDTPINYPVAQGEDNNEYLRTMLNGEYNIGGTLFADYRNAADMSDWNTVIYGHNMRTNTMFGSLSDYGSQEYYDAHPIWYLLTPNMDYEVELLAAYVTTTSSMAYEMPMSKERKADFVENCRKNSRFAADVAVGEDDRLVTFSTCTSSAEDARYILVGVLREMAPTKPKK